MRLLQSINQSTLWYHYHKSWLSDNGHEIQTKIEPGQASQTDQYHTKILSCYIHCYSVLLLQTARQKLARKMKDLPITNHQYCIQILIVFIVANAHFLFFWDTIFKLHHWQMSLSQNLGSCQVIMKFSRNSAALHIIFHRRWSLAYHPTIITVQNVVEVSLSRFVNPLTSAVAAIAVKKV